MVLKLLLVSPKYRISLVEIDGHCYIKSYNKFKKTDNLLQAENSFNFLLSKNNILTEDIVTKFHSRALYDGMKCALRATYREKLPFDLSDEDIQKIMASIRKYQLALMKKRGVSDGE